MKLLRKIALNRKIQNITTELYRVESFNVDPFPAHSYQMARRPVAGYQADRSFHLRKELDSLYEQKKAIG